MKTKRIGITLILSLSLLLVWLLGSTTLPYVRAAAYTVTNGNPAGPGSLRQVILDANASPDVDTITFQFPTSGSGVIVLTETLPAITGDLILDGPGADYLAISGDNAHRILSITAGSQVTLSGLTLRDGYADNGGGIYSAGDLLLIDTYISGNTATQNGGGLYAVTGTTTLSNTYVVSNVAQTGGGLYITHTHVVLEVYGGEIRDNTATSADWATGGGGGIYSTAGNVLLSGTQIMSNTTFQGGGGAYIEQGDWVIITNTDLLHNHAKYGGGLYADSDDLHITEGWLYDNSADSGGGIYSGALNTLIQNSRIQSNTVTDSGGGILMYSITATIKSTQILDNKASGEGGGINYHAYDSPLLKIEDSLIHHNTAYIGGGMFFNGENEKIIITHTQITSNTALSEGGAIFGDGGDTILNNTSVKNNSAEAGGGMFILSGQLMLNKTQVNNNTADFAGGISLLGDTLTIEDSQVNNNSADYSGGISMWGDSLAISDSQINNNSALGIGGIDASSDIIILTNTQVLSNTDNFYYDNLNIAQGYVILGKGVEIGQHYPVSTTNALYISNSTISNTSALTLFGHVRQEEDSTFYSNDYPLHIEGELALLGGDFYAPPDFTLTGPFSHTGGTYYQTQVVNGSQDVGFPKEGGLLLNAQGRDLGSTQVAITAGEIWTGLGHSGMVRHYAAITPTNTTDQNATLTLYYQDTEIPPGQSCALMEVSRYTDSTGHLLTRDAVYGVAGRVCDSTPHAIRVAGVQDFATFVLHTLQPYPAFLPLLLRN